MARLHGRTGAIALSANTSPAGSPADNEFTAVGSLNLWAVSFTRELLETTSIRSAAKTYAAALQDVRGQFEGTFDTDYIQALMSANTDADGVWIRITPSTDYPEIFVQGSAWIDISLAGAVRDAVKVSGTFVGNGAWQQSYSA